MEGKYYSQKEMENAVMLAADMYKRLYEDPSLPGGSMEIAGTIIREAVEMERWLTGKYGKDDDCYLDRLEEYEGMMERKYGLPVLTDDGIRNYYGRITSLHYEIVTEIARLMTLHGVTEVDLLGSSCDHAYVSGYHGDGADVQEMEVSRVHLGMKGDIGAIWLDVILDVDTEELAAKNPNGDIGDAYQCWNANDFTHFKPCGGIELVYESVYQVLE